MDYSHLDFFCNNLGTKPNTDRYAVSFTIAHINGLAKEVKREVNIELNNVNCDKIYFLNYHLSEVKNTKGDEDFCAVSTNEKLVKYNVTFEDILNDNVEDTNLNEVLNTEYAKVTESNSYKEVAFEIQLELYQYIISYFKADMIKFLEDKKAAFSLDSSDSSSKIKWIGKPSQLGFIIRHLVDMGYIEAPVKKTGEINYTQFAKIVKTTFDIVTTEDTLIKYLNFDSEKSQSIIRKFDEIGFNIPHKNRIS